jgi:SAM-dependent methyltransferase
VSPTPPERGAKIIRGRQRELWAATVDEWHGFDPSTKLLTDTLIAAAEVKRSDHVIDLACGTGMPALAEASVVGPEGRVLGLDLVADMIVVAQAEALSRGISNIEFRTIATEKDLGVPDDGFDAATCKHGLMWMPEPLAALEALYRALKSGGRVAVSSWCDISRNSLLSIVPHVARRHLVLPADWPAMPPSPLLSAESLVSLLEESGFIDVRCDSVFLTWEEGESAAEYVHGALQDDEILADALRAVSPDVRAAVHREVLDGVSLLVPPGPVMVQMETLVASGMKPRLSS